MDKVRFLGFNEAMYKDGGDDPRGVLVENEEYTIQSEAISTELTLVKLEGIDGVFNSEMFEDVIGE